VSAANSTTSIKASSPSRLTRWASSNCSLVRMEAPERFRLMSLPHGRCPRQMVQGTKLGKRRVQLDALSIANARKAAIAIRQIISIARSACIHNSVFQRAAAPRTTVVGKHQCLLSTLKRPSPFSLTDSRVQRFGLFLRERATIWLAPQGRCTVVAGGHPAKGHQWVMPTALRAVGTVQAHTLPCCTHQRSHARVEVGDACGRPQSDSAVLIPCCFT
jgi:hypothetical protein